MSMIVSPLTPGMRGAAVADLQDALQRGLEGSLVSLGDYDERTRRKWSASLQHERADQTYGEVTRHLVSAFQAAQGLPAIGEVDEPTANALNRVLGPDTESWTIQGAVTQLGKPREGITVEAFDRDLRKRQLLGSAVTLEDGSYLIEYHTADFAEGDRRSAPAPWLVVEAWEPDGGQRVAAPKGRNVQRTEVINLAFDSDDPSDYDRLEEAILPLLDGQREDGSALLPSELSANDAAFVAEDAGIDRHLVDLWISAASTAGEVQLLGHGAHSEPSDVDEQASHAWSDDDRLESVAFFAWFRDGLPRSFEHVIGRSPDALMESLIRATAEGWIPALTQTQSARIRAALDERRVTEALKPAGENGRATLGAVLSTVGGSWLTPDTLRAIAPIALDVPVDSDEFLGKLEPLVENEVRRREVRRTLRLGELAQRHVPMIEALQPLATISGDDTIRRLASLERDQWLDLAYDRGVPAESSLSPAEYARRMEEQVERDVPTASLAARLVSHPFLSTTPAYASLIPALENHTAFNIESDDIEAFAREADLDPSQERALHQLQHLRRLGTRWDEAGALLERGLDSVGRIVDLGPEGFKTEMGDLLNDDRAAAIYSQSQLMHVASVGLMGAIQHVLLPQAGSPLESSSDQDELALIDQNPTLRRLFGALETCACGHCRSVLSPAAYLVDLLKFVDASDTARHELRRRRPDLYDLELSCDNSQIELTHIDLVNEILENKVALPLIVPLAAGVSADEEIKRVPLGAAVRTELQRTSLDPIGELTAVEDRWSTRPRTLVDGTSFWVVTDRHRRWVLQASIERFSLRSSAHDVSIDPAGLNVADVLAAFELGTVHASIRPRFEAALIATQRPLYPATVENLTVVPLAERAWTIEFSLVANLRLEIDEGALVLATTDVELRRPYSRATIEASRAALARGEIPDVIATNVGLPPTVEVSTDPNEGRLHSSHSVRLVYQPSELTINGLTYQSTARGEDLIARPQNRNPRAYETLNGKNVRFPWTLPYDAELCAVRALLAKAGASRLSLLELANPPDSSITPVAIVREILGLSAEEAARIRTELAGDAVWAVWGLKMSTAGTGPLEVFDSFADEMVDGTGVELLGRVSVLMQQARISFVELQQLLGSTWINPGGLPITPDHLCDPTGLRVAVTETLLDRMHRFVRLWRALGWKIWEVDRALRTPAIADDGLGDRTLRNLANLERLAAQLEQPIEVLVTWFASAFTDDSHLYEHKDELLEERPLYDRLFQDRRLSVTPDPDLAFGAVNPSPPAAPTRSLTEKVGAVASAFGVRESTIRELVASTVIDPGGISGARMLTNPNLVWVFRHAILLKRTRLSVEQYEAAWRVRGGTPFASPGELLGFLDDLDQVRRTGMTWRALQYVLRGSGEEETALSTVQASAILAAMQRTVTTQAAMIGGDSHFGLTQDDLADPALSTPPSDAAERWTRWGLTQGRPRLNWTVRNPEAPERTLVGEPLTLLSRLSVLAQQLRTNVGDVRALLRTRFVVPDGVRPLTIGPASATDPQLVVSNLAPVHLDRLERLAALWRRTGLGIRELDLMIRAMAVTEPAEPLSDDLTALAEKGATIAALRDRLGVALDTAIAWQAGLGGRTYRKYAPSGVDSGADSGVFERMFGTIDRLALDQQRERLAVEATPPASPWSWADLDDVLAPALGVPASELAFLIESGVVPPAVTLRNLEAFHRVVTLSSALGLTTREFLRFATRFARVEGRDWRSSPEAMFAFVDTTLHLLQRSEAIASQAATSMQLDPTLTADVLWDAIDVPQGATATRIPAMELFLESPLLASGTVQDPASLDATPEFGVLVRLEKLRRLNAAWKATPTELRWLWREPPAVATFSGLTLNALPASSADTPASFIDWRRTTTLFTLAHSAPALPGMLSAYRSDLKSSRSPEEITAGFKTIGISFGLAEASAPSEVAVFAKLLDADTAATDPDPPPQLDPLKLAPLLALLGLARRLGLSAEAFETLIADPATIDSVSVAKTVLRSRFSEQTWSRALQDASDEVREAERDRLADYLVWREGVRNADALYERYLIDVQMGACMKTTRLLLSIAAAQLFIQRCLLNLERPRISADSIPNRDRWEWMRSFRVWEANRKVFLYPENWLYPELRDDRSETFRGFESALTQSEPSDESAALALRQFLDDLLDVGQITTLGLYEHTQPATQAQDRSSQPAQTTLFVVGRSVNPPYRFYWRTASSYGVPGTRWTSWERIDADLSGDHALPFVIGGDLHVAWPVINQVERADTTDFELQIAMARRTPAGWTSRQISRDKLTVEKRLYRTERTTFMLKLRTLELGRSVAIDVFSVEKPTRRGETVHDPNQFRLTSETQKTKSAATDYWELRLTVAGFIKFRDTQRVDKWPCQVTLWGFKPDTATSYTPDGRAQVGTFAPAELAAQTFSIQGNVTVRLQAIFEMDGQLFFTPEVTFDLTDDNEVLKHEHSGQSKYEAAVNFLVTGLEDPEEPSELAPLYMRFRKTFILQLGREISVEDPAQRYTELPAPGFLFASGGQLEYAAGPAPFPPYADQSGSGRLFALESGPHPSRSVSSFAGASTHRTTYLEEEDRRWFVRHTRPGFTASLQGARDKRTAIYAAGYADPIVYKERASYGLAVLFDLDSQMEPINSQLGVSSLDQFITSSSHAEVDARDSSVVQFDLAQPHASYNWEVFLHLPLAAATFLSRQQRFEDARRWFHYVFDPTTTDSSPGRARFWRFLPFRHANQPDSITRLLEVLGGRPESAAEEVGGVAKEVRDQVFAWLADPFNPFAVARLRPSAFEWYTVISYVKNLIAWGDQLFRRDTRESINDATLQYVLAATILGRRPEPIEQRGAEQAPLSYRTLDGRWDDFGNKWLALADNPLVQEFIQLPQWLGQVGLTNSHGVWDQIAQLSSIGSLYFCVPPNEKLPELWDTVEDRLFKIRQCQNIEGMRRELPFFEPPIDPELLIRARAAGLDIADVLADRFAPLPYQRFQVLLQTANEFCADVRNLGATLLSTLEKKEAEQLALLRSQQELEMLRLVEEVRTEQLHEAQANIDSLEKTRRNALDRFAYLQRQLGKSDLTLDATGAPIVEQALMLQVQESGATGDSRSLALVHAETEQVRRLQDGHIWSMVAGVVKTSAAAAHVVGLNPYAKDSANALGMALSAAGEGLGLIATNAAFWERRATLISGWQRRRDQWVHDSKMTSEEIRQIDKQLIALKIRKCIAENELENHRKQIEFASNVDEFTRRLKFTRESLYAWMESQLADVYFSANRLAYDLARRAERAYRFELGDDTASFVRFGHWDALREGLLAGERLGSDLKRMEAAYLDRNRRELEITKHMSLRQLDPLALWNLRVEGECEFDVPEAIFDIDFPGHYYRRLKTVSVSVPCVVGPYTSVSGTLTLLSSRMRHNATAANDYSDEANYRIGVLPIQSIATSSAQNDPGMFELNFRDERYLPFECAGAISRWRFTLPAPEFAAFDYDTISDVILHIRYTARDGGQSLRDRAQAGSVDRLNAIVQGQGESEGLTAMFPLRQDFQIEWERFKGEQADLSLQLTERMFPYMFRSRVKVQSGHIVWTGQTAAVPLTSDDEDLPTLTVLLTDGAELRTATDPHLIVSYRI